MAPPATMRATVFVLVSGRFMKGSLLDSNAWLREPRPRANLLRVSAASSSAVEGIFQPFRERPAGTVNRPARKRAKSAPARG